MYQAEVQTPACMHGDAAATPWTLPQRSCQLAPSSKVTAAVRTMATQGSTWTGQLLLTHKHKTAFCQQQLLPALTLLPGAA
jgi:hypothetical protein